MENYHPGVGECFVRKPALTVKQPTAIGLREAKAVAPIHQRTSVSISVPNLPESQRDLSSRLCVYGRFVVTVTIVASAGNHFS
jgi:hypothetical protein